jgi:peroxiredoxin
VSLAKSAFSTFFVSFHAFSFALAMGALFTNASPAWLGVALISGAALFDLFAPLVHEPAERVKTWRGLTVATAGALVAIVGSPPGAPGANAAGVLGTLGLATFFAYALWQVRLEQRPSSMLAPGGRLPPLELLDTDGAVVTTRDLRGTPSVIIFHRGSFSPRCLGQLRSFAAHGSALEALGVKVWVVSADPPAEARALAARLGPGFACLIDERSRAANALQIAHPHPVPLGISLLGFAGESALPTVLVTDARGVIRLLRQASDARARTHPRTVLEALADDGRGGTHGAVWTVAARPSLRTAPYR